jgi:hypothetical protein
VNSVFNLRIPYNAGKLSSVLDLSSSAQLQELVSIFVCISGPYIDHS